MSSAEPLDARKYHPLLNMNNVFGILQKLVAEKII